MLRDFPISFFFQGKSEKVTAIKHKILLHFYSKNKNMVYGEECIKNNNISRNNSGFGDLLHWSQQSIDYPLVISNGSNHNGRFFCARPNFLVRGFKKALMYP